MTRRQTPEVIAEREVEQLEHWLASGQLLLDYCDMRGDARDRVAMLLRRDRGTRQRLRDARAVGAVLLIEQAQQAYREAVRIADEATESGLPKAKLRADVRLRVGRELVQLAERLDPASWAPTVAVGGSSALPPLATMDAEERARRIDAILYAARERRRQAEQEPTNGRAGE